MLLLHPEGSASNGHLHTLASSLRECRQRHAGTSGSDEALRDSVPAQNKSLGRPHLPTQLSLLHPSHRIPLMEALRVRMYGFITGGDNLPHLIFKEINRHRNQSGGQTKETEGRLTGTHTHHIYSSKALSKAPFS